MNENERLIPLHSLFSAVDAMLRKKMIVRFHCILSTLIQATRMSIALVVVINILGKGATWRMIACQRTLSSKSFDIL